MLLRRLILLPVLCTYLLVSSLAGLGRVVICHDVDGGIALESEGSGCCTREHSVDGHDDDRARLDGLKESGTCEHCTDISLGDLPSLMASTSSAVAKAVPADAALHPAIATAWTVPFVVVPQDNPSPPQASNLSPRAPELLLQGIVLRC